MSKIFTLLYVPAEVVILSTLSELAEVSEVQRIIERSMVVPLCCPI